MQDFRRDTPADQRRVRDAYNRELARRADEEIAGMRRSLDRGASVSEYGGEAEDMGPSWLDAYMSDQQEPDQRLAMGGGLLSDDRAKRDAFEAGARAAGGHAADVKPALLPDYMQAPATQEERRARIEREAMRRIQASQTQPQQAAPVGPQPGEAPIAPTAAEPSWMDRLQSFVSDDRAKGGKAKLAGTDRITRQLGEGLAPIEFEYKPGLGPQGRRPGVRAQGALTQPLTAPMVTRRPDGYLGIDQAQGLGTALAGVGHLSRKVAELEKRKGGR
jgi:hypothetical protein